MCSRIAFCLWSPWLFQGSEHFKGRAANKRGSHFLGLRKERGFVDEHTLVSHAAQDARACRMRGSSFRPIISEEDRPVVIKGAYSALLPNGFLRSLISDRSCQGFKYFRIWFSSVLKDICRVSSVAIRTDQKLVD